MKNMIRGSILNYSPTILETLLNLNYENMPKTDELAISELIKTKFYSAKKFTEEIEKVVLENKDMKYVDAIVFFCEKNNLDVESVPKLITKPLKEKLKCEAMELNLLKRTSHAKLPL